MLAAANRQYNSKFVLGEAIVNESSKIGLFKNEEGRCKRRSTCKGKVGNRLLLFSSRQISPAIEFTEAMLLTMDG